MHHRDTPTIPRHVLESLLSEGLTLAEMAKRLGKAKTTVSYWMDFHRLEPLNRATHARPRNIDRERLERLVEAGQTVAQMAVELGITAVTVRRRLVRYGLKTEATRRMLRAREAEKAGLDTLTMSCPEHGETEFILEGRGYFRCKQCRMGRVARRRRRVKEILVADAGGRCRLCGYDKYPGALEFHHLDPKEKRLEISYVALALEAMREEARKCVLLCSNCHAEVEAGVATVPLQFPRQVPNKEP
jgi:DNA-binding CsgD family transcriptional regulator